MEKLKEINKLKEEMKIKRTLIGGFDKNDVYAKIEELSKRYQDLIEELENEHASVIESYQARLDECDQTIMDMKKESDRLTTENQGLQDEKQELVEEKIKLAEEKTEMKQVYKDRCSSLVGCYADSLRSLSKEFTQVLDNIASMQKDLMETEMLDLFGEESTPDLLEDDYVDYEETVSEVKEDTENPDHYGGEDFEDENEQSV